jgi:ATP-dependent DNA helicase DinG
MTQATILTRSQLITNTFTSTMPQQFVGYEPRPQQLDMALAVNNALERGHILLAEAPTGTGKSLANLIPAVIHLDTAQKPAIISTATIALQEQYMNKDIPLVKQLGFQFRAELAKGKNNYLCLLKAQSAKEYDANLEEVLDDWTEMTTTGDRSDAPEAIGHTWSDVCADDDCVGSECPHHSKCFYQLARARLQSADIIITNHHLLMADMAVRLSSGGDIGVLPEASGVIIDEAHALEDVARDALGVKISRFRLPQLLSRIRKQFNGIQGLDDLKRTHDQLFDSIMDYAVKANAYTGPIEADAPWIDDAEQLARTCSLLSETLYEEAAFEDNQGLRYRMAEQMARYGWDLVNMITKRDFADYVAYYELQIDRANPYVTLRLAPINIAHDMRELFWAANPAAVLTSATLTTGNTFDYVKQQLGIGTCQELELTSPFDYKSQALLYVPRNEVPDPSDADFHERIAPIIEQILLHTEGRAFVLFASHRGMEKVYRLLSDRLRWTVLKQGQAPNSQLIERFKRDKHSVLFGTASFWEGVDVQGESLSCVIIDKLPFPNYQDPLVRVQEQMIRNRGGNSFKELMMPVAALKLKQGFGRVIRTKTDKGLVAVLDRRIRTKPYGRYFWQSLPECTYIGSMENVDLFLRSEGGAAS